VQPHRPSAASPQPEGSVLCPGSERGSALTGPSGPGGLGASWALPASTLTRGGPPTGRPRAWAGLAPCSAPGRTVVGIRRGVPGIRRGVPGIRRGVPGVGSRGAEDARGGGGRGAGRRPGGPGAPDRRSRRRCRRRRRRRRHRPAPGRAEGGAEPRGGEAETRAGAGGARAG
jgi:hypothetical protein